MTRAPPTETEIKATGRELVPTQAPRTGLAERLAAFTPSRPEAKTEPPAPPQPARRTAKGPPPPSLGGTVGAFEFHPHRLQADDAPPSPATRWVATAIVALFATALAWGYFGRLASYTSAAGKIQAVGRTKVVEALAKGQVQKILVREGDVVKEGQVLVELDPTTALAQRTIIDQKLSDMRAETLRRQVEIGAARNDPVDPNAKIDWDKLGKVTVGAKTVPKPVRIREAGVAHAELAQLAAQLATLVSQKHAKEAERDKYQKSIKAQAALLAVTDENLKQIDTLQKQGYNSMAKYLDTKAQIDQQKVTQAGFEGSLENAKQSILLLDSQIAKTRETFVTTNVQSVATGEQTIVDLEQQLIKADQTLTNMTLRAPVGGTVHTVGVTTIGQVVTPGQQLMQIVPGDGPLEIETYVTNTDIGFIRVGDPATIKVTTFVYGTYGAVDGTVTSVSTNALPTTGKDTIQNGSLDGEYTTTTTAQKTGTLQFPVTIKTARATMLIDGKEVPLTPGMSVSVEIETERRRAIDYIVSPIVDLFSTAAHEK